MTDLKQFNGVLITGDVKEFHAKKKYIILETKNKGFDGTIYSDSHRITVKGKMPACVKIGDRIAMKGALDVVNKRTLIKAIEINPALPKDEYVNMARLVGELKHSFRILPSTFDKIAVGNMLVTVGDMIFRGKSFGPVAVAMKRVFKKGSIVRAEGRLNFQKYPNKTTGEPDGMLEIILDEERTEVLIQAIDNDPFAAFDAPAAPIDETGPEAASSPI
jgi:hypothetical protein